ncbi:MAG: glycosyltransferase family protein [Chitinophagaceae bacterium]
MSKQMKILYAVQATGNGHIARATQLMPYLQQYGSVDVFLSGSNSHLATQDLHVKYRSKGVSLFYGNRGGLDYYKMFKAFSLPSIIKEAKQLPVHKYDVVINDFESITSLACKFHKKQSIQFGHQASFLSKNTPRPLKRDIIGEWILKNYATATHQVGLHFQSYDSFIFSPIIKKNILQANITDEGHITVYLSHFSDEVVVNALRSCTDFKFHIFSKKVTSITRIANCILFPIQQEAFNKSIISAHGVITGAGFETPAEVLYLGKKLLCIPIAGQYEQLCNAAALEAFRVPIIQTIYPQFTQSIYRWLAALPPKPLTIQYSTEAIVAKVFDIAFQQQPQFIIPQFYPEQNNLDQLVFS